MKIHYFVNPSLKKRIFKMSSKLSLSVEMTDICQTPSNHLVHLNPALHNRPQVQIHFSTTWDETSPLFFFLFFFKSVKLGCTSQYIRKDLSLCSFQHDLK